jgi:hypothetical protein
MFWKKPKYWIIRRSFTGVNIVYCDYPRKYSYDTILEGPLNTKEEATEAFKYWSTHRHDFGGIFR